LRCARLAARELKLPLLLQAARICWRHTCLRSCRRCAPWHRQHQVGLGCAAQQLKQCIVCWQRFPTCQHLLLQHAAQAEKCAVREAVTFLS
jgi:hypothetical protein